MVGSAFAPSVVILRAMEMSKDKKQHQNGKGDKRRPEDSEKYRKGWDRVFGGKKSSK